MTLRPAQRNRSKGKPGGAPSSQSSPLAPVSVADLLTQATREYILIAGKDGVGKTSALLSLADMVQSLDPGAAFHLIDVEHKTLKLLKTWRGGPPRNIQYFDCATMNDVVNAVA